MVRCLDTKVLAIVSGKHKPEHASHEGQVHRCTLCTEDPLAKQLAPQKVSYQRGRGSEDGKDCHSLLDRLQSLQSSDNCQRLSCVCHFSRRAAWMALKRVTADGPIFSTKAA